MQPWREVEIKGEMRRWSRAMHPRICGLLYLLLREYIVLFSLSVMSRRLELPQNNINVT